MNTTDAEQTPAFTPAANARAAVEAIRLAWSLTPGAPVSDSDRRTLLAWTGWGALAPAFDKASTGHWRAVADDLEDILSPKALEAASAQVDTSFYTPKHLTDIVFDLLTSAGFTGGSVLEPGCGSGRFMAAAPAGLDIDWTGVEIDPTAARIAQLLNSDADIIAKPLEKSTFVTGGFDAVVGNVPFSSSTVFDSAYASASLHEYFLIRALDAVREGGYVIAITSRFTMDANYGLGRLTGKDQQVDGAELLAALRLPAGAFASEGTDVVADILVFRKRALGEPSRGWDDAAKNAVTRLNSYTAVSNRLNVTESIDPGTKGIATEVNAYWGVHPEHVAGTMKVGSFFRNPLTVVSDDPAADIARAVAAVKTQLIPQAERIDLAQAFADVQLVDADGRKEGSFHVIDGSIVEVIDGALVPIRNSAELRALIRLRDAATTLVALESDFDLPDHFIDEARTAALTEYQAYFDAFGALNRGEMKEGKEDPDTGLPTLTWRRPTMAGFRRDPDYSTTIAMEEFDQDEGVAAPAPILLRRVNKKPVPVERVDTAGEAVAVSLGETGTIDLARVAQLLDLYSEADALKALGDLVYIVDGRVLAARDYLSGNIREKLAAERRAAEQDPTRARNVAALEAVMPADLGALEIKVTLGAPWIPAAVVTLFAKEVLGAGVRITHTPEVATWEVGDGRVDKDAALAYGTGRATALQLLDWALNGKNAVIYDETWNRFGGGSTKTRNVAESMAASEKMRALDDRFSLWVWEDEARAAATAAEYNRRFNSHVARVADGSHLTFPGLADGIELWKHQRDAVDRIISQERTLIGHPVGAGKTLELITAAMTLKRLGLATKPMIAVPNHLLEQIVREAQQAYPTGKFLIAGREDLVKDRRRVFAARAATGDWDAIVITHQSLVSLPLSPEAETEWVENQKADLRSAMQGQDGYSGGRGPKAIARSIRALETRLTAVRDGVTDAETVLFEHLGVDHLMVDECFPFDTLVETDRGPIAIGQIVEQGLKVRVASTNLQSGKTEFKRIDRWVKKANNDGLIRISHEGGSFDCTPNHPVWVEGAGYVRADQIVPGQELRVLRSEVLADLGSKQVLLAGACENSGAYSSLREGSVPILRDRVRTNVDDAGGVRSALPSEAGSAEEGVTNLPDHLRALRVHLLDEDQVGSVLFPSMLGAADTGASSGSSRITSSETLPPVPVLVPAEDGQVEVLHPIMPNAVQHTAEVRAAGVRAVPRDLHADAPEAEVLWATLLDGVEEFWSSWSSAGSSHAEDAHARAEHTRGTCEVERPDDGEEPHARSAIRGENDCFDAGSNVLVSRWEWSDDRPAETASGTSTAPYGVLYSDPASMGSVRVSPELLRRRLGIRAGKAGDRGRWEDAQAEKVEVLGSPENGNLGSSRVVSVEVLERGGSRRHGARRGGDSSGDGFVYNIEVADNHNYFAEGVLVSNCHLFRRLSTESKSRDSGFSTGGSKRATDLLMKIESLAARRPGAPVVSLFTGTPWANTLAETWVWQRYLQPEALESAGVSSFDPWVATFVKFENAIEVAPDGNGFRMNRRPVGMKNLPELVTMLSLVADIRSADDIGLQRPAHTKHNLVAQPGPQQLAFVKELAARADAIRGAGKVQRPDGNGDDSMLLVCNDGRAVALDPRLVGIDELSPKILLVAAKMAEVYHQNADRQYGDSAVPGAFQLGLLDLGTPHPGDARVYGRLRALLVGHGVPATKIRFIHEVTSDRARSALFAQCRDGSVSILLGSTSKVGIGTNIQTRLLSLFHIDAPWTPAEIEQREGRALRPKNLNPHVDIYRVVTEKTFDSYLFQALERKARSFAALYAHDPSVREVEDIGGATLSFGEVKALAAGNPLLLEQAKVGAEVQRLKLMRSVHLQGVNRSNSLARDAVSLADKLEYDARYDDKVTAAVAAAPVIHGENPNLMDFARSVESGDKPSYRRYPYRGLSLVLKTAEGLPKGTRRVALDFDYYEMQSLAIKAKFARSGLNDVAEFIAGEFDRWIDSAPGRAAKRREQATALRIEAVDHERAGANSVFAEDDKLAAAMAKLARIEAEIEASVEQPELVAA